MDKASMIGKSIPRIESAAKVQGSAQYVGDIILPGMLRAKILRSHLPHAKILNIDTSKALKVPGVKAIITGQDTLGKTLGPLEFNKKYMDETLLATDKVRYIGDPVAAVAAVNEDAALEALEKIEVQYEELPAVFTIDEARQEGAPLVHENNKGNISRRIFFDFGDIEQSWRDSHYIHEETYETAANQHVPLEPRGCVATFDTPDKLTIWTSTQVPYIVRSNLAYALGMNESQVRVIMPFVGGGFGGKADGVFSSEFCAALLAKKTGKPVRLIYSREEEFTSGRRRHPAKIYLKTGVTKEGVITGCLAECALDGGAYNGYGPATILLCGIFLNVPYRLQAFKYEGLRYYTNNPVSSAMRGHGAPQVHFAFDQQLDQMASKIGMDPVEIRLKNALETGEITQNGLKIHSSGFKECIQKVVQESHWSEKKGKLPANHGIGIGCSGFPSGSGYRQHPEIPTYSSALVRLNEDGSVLVLSGAADSGQGSDTVLLQIAAEELGVDFEICKFIRADTDITPADLGNFSSRTTVFAGNAVRKAALEVRKQMSAFLGKLWEVESEKLVFSGGLITVTGVPMKQLTFQEAAKKMLDFRTGEPVVGNGFYDPPERTDYQTWTFGAQVTELKIDPETGKIDILNIVNAHDCGKAVNHMAVDGQIQGSVHMGMGFAVTEEMLMEEGRVMNPALLDYNIVQCGEMPPINAIHVESIDPLGPFGAKEAGEGTLGPVAPSIGNAVYDAIGVRVNTLPLKSSNVFNSMKKGEKR